MTIDASEAGHRLAELHGDYLFEHPTYEGLSDAERVYIAVWRFEAEVYNGGLQQMLTNSTGEYVPLICHSLKLVGAEKMALIVERAVKEIVSDPRYDHSVEKLVRRADDVRHRLFELGRQLTPDIKNLSVLLFQYMSRHRDQFHVSEEFWSEATMQ